MMLPGPECPCGSDRLEHACSFKAAPEGETHFVSAAFYYRELWRCRCCGHYVARHAIDLSRLYDGAYTQATYGSAAKARFDRIIALPPEKSDNEGRVRRLKDLAIKNFSASTVNSTPIRILDVGSGLCVFLHLVSKKLGWDCVALDPDPSAVAHARDVAEVQAVRGDFLRDELMDLDWPGGLGEGFDIITFNKVLEHVKDPVRMLAKAYPLLKKNGFVYCEIPDAEEAANSSLMREEFFLEHWHVFSMSSTALCAVQAGFVPLYIERIVEPSGKKTIWTALRQ